MNTGNWTKLYGNIIYSTVWQEEPEIRCVWITMLAISDSEGYVGSSIPGLAKAAGVDVAWVEKSLKKFLSPDKYSRTDEHEGRRIEEQPGGWKLLNFIAHRDGNEDQREKWRQQKERQRARAVEELAQSGNPLTPKQQALKDRAKQREYEKRLKLDGKIEGARAAIHDGLKQKGSPTPAEQDREHATPGS